MDPLENGFAGVVGGPRDGDDRGCPVQVSVGCRLEGGRRHVGVGDGEKE
jgi:hypothetical protein